MEQKCPSETVGNAFPQDLDCPKCGEPVEIFSDEQRARCLGCKTKLARTSDDPEKLEVVAQ